MKRRFKKWKNSWVDFWSALSKGLEEHLTFGRLIAVIALVVAVVGVNVQVFQIYADLKSEVRAREWDNHKEAFRKQSYLASLSLELQRNQQEAAKAIQAYKESKIVGIAPQYTSDMYKAGLASGDILFLDEKARNSILAFYNSLPHYEALVNDFDESINTSEDRFFQCVAAQGECSMQGKDMKDRHELRSMSINSLSQTKEEFLKAALQNLKYADT